MKRNLLFLMGAFAATTWLGCSHTGTKKESTASNHHPGMERKLAGLMDAGIAGPNGEVILFYKNGNKIVIQRCEDGTALNRREDCTTKPGTAVTQVPVNEFKNRLKAALRVPGDYTSAMKMKIDLYKKEQDGIADLESQRAEVQREIMRIQNIIDFYGEENAAQREGKDELKQELGVIERKLADNSERAGAIREFNQIIDKLVDQIIGQPTLQKFVYSKDKQSFVFNILRSYINTPGISAPAQFINIRAGSFQMGSPTSEPGRHDDEILHSVTLTKDFEIQQTEVTQADWFLVMGYNPSEFKRKENCPDDYLKINGTTGLCPNHPVERVSWVDIQDFIKRLNEGNDGYAYRLPTEAEWEFAARGGTQTAYSFGDDSGSMGDYAWNYYNSGKQTHAVGSKKANPYGLYDVHGNVWEWVQDRYARSAASYFTGSQVDPVGPASGPASSLSRVIRGASWEDREPRSAFRTNFGPVGCVPNVGFRLVRMPR